MNNNSHPFFLNKVKSSFLLLVALSVFCTMTSQAQQTITSKDAWAKFPEIIKGITTPVFQDKVFNILDFGARPDGVFDNTVAIKKAIEKCTKKGGGVVLVPAGKYFTGPIHLDNNVNLHLAEGAEILFNTDPAVFPIVHTTFEGTECMNYSPLIYAYNKQNVAVTGKGTLNGQSSNEKWWPWCSSARYGWKKDTPNQKEDVYKLMDLADKNVPVSERIFGKGHYLRPNFIEFFECKTVLIQGVQIVNTPFWVIHPMKSVNVIVDGVSIKSHGPNNDGCDPEYSKNVWIKNTTFDTGDDCIAIKSGRDNDGRRVAIKSENIIVQDCKMYDGHGGVTIGSEISAGVSNVYVENCVMDSPELDRAIRIKSNSRRGGLVENVFVRNIKVGEVKESVLGIDLHYGVHGNQTGTFMPQVQNIFIENTTVKNGGLYGILAKGHKGFPIKNIRFQDVIIEKVETDYLIENVEGVKLVNTYINGHLMESPKNN
ncbi:glycoside hydrolase family 28 protein [Flavobacterium sp.]|uniref:glycoside hydrolase family 28 protein n=1 Tax=Flavobacterium sp. TaxID=239 RepID=UPI0025FD810E|nr:glycoside hydrolase family 28 protein [Flavobacterium sp.]